MQKVIEHVDIRGNKPSYPLSHDLDSKKISTAILSWLSRQSRYVQKNVQFFGIFPYNELHGFQNELKNLYHTSFYDIWKKNLTIHQASFSNQSGFENNEWKCKTCSTINLSIHPDCVMCNNKNKNETLSTKEELIDHKLKKTIEQEAQQLSQWSEKEEKKEKQKLLNTQAEMEEKHKNNNNNTETKSNTSIPLSQSVETNKIYKLFFYAEPEEIVKKQKHFYELNATGDKDQNEPRYLFALLDDVSGHSELLIIDKITQSIELYNTLCTTNTENKNIDISNVKIDHNKLPPTPSSFVELISEQKKIHGLSIPLEIYTIYEDIKAVSNLKNWNVRVKKDEILSNFKLKTNLINLYYLTNKLEQQFDHPFKNGDNTPYHSIFSNFFD